MQHEKSVVFDRLLFMDLIIERIYLKSHLPAERNMLEYS